MSSSSAPLSTPEGPLSVSGAPNLPAGFTDTFTSRYIDTGELRQHAVIGGDGPPLLLVHGWPENWYAWRLLMPALARDFEVIAVDQRGIGLTDKPEGGYDTGTLAADLVALMDALGHERFAVVGHDTGLIISYALAADHPDRVDRLAVAEVPEGVASGRHCHPGGPEVGYIVGGDVAMEFDDRLTLTLRAGDPFMILHGVIHNARNTGTVTTKMLSTYVVDETQLLATLLDELGPRTVPDNGRSVPAAIPERKAKRWRAVSSCRRSRPSRRRGRGSWPAKGPTTRERATTGGSRT
jgi:pimeloyl-ACP methyl ester carboxylesterase